jgi:hypothetical protein
VISLSATLACDHCRRPFRSRSYYFRDAVQRRQLEQIRADAHRRGWRRYRVSVNGPNGDYCPACQRIHAKAKAKRAGARPRKGPPK